MVYVAPDGTVYQHAPWSIQRLLNLLWGIVAFVVFFFKSLFGLDTATNTSYNNGRGGRGNGPGGGGGGRGFKTMGRVTTITDCSMPGGG